MECKYCGRQTKYVDVCRRCSIEEDADTEDLVSMERGNAWGIKEVIMRYEGALTDE